MDRARARSRALLGALAAELGHDLQGPLNLFRLALDRVERGHPLDHEDLEGLREELERLARLNGRLRGLARERREKSQASLDELLELALVFTADTADLRVESTACAQSISCDAELVALALSELLKNALEAKASEAGVQLVLGERTGYCVWDDGPGFSSAFEEQLAWGVSTRPGAAGLGLTLALRAAKAHGLTLESRRQAARTEVWLLIPQPELSPRALEASV